MSPEEEDTSTGSSASMALVTTWLQNCVEHHSGKRCQPADPRYLPTRILDLEAFCDDAEPRVKLYVPQQPEKALYIALSHCWGNEQSVMTTKVNLSKYQKSIPKELLSKTFQEAIDVTLQLGIRYLWIDTLCIIQDSIEDWNSESALMSEVYSNALATIFAAKASNGSQGCFANRNAMMNHPCKLELRFTTGRSVYVAPFTGHAAGASGPLYNRAWVYQEEVLSQRSIAFATHGVYWACHTIAANEQLPAGAFNFSHSRAAFQHLLPSLSTPSENPSQSKQERLHDPWYHIVAHYGERALTVPTDRLPALSALASILHSHAREDRYLAGLWQDDLLRGLLWTSSLSNIDREMPAAPYVAPSWSWASLPTGGMIGYTWMGGSTRIGLAPWKADLMLCNVEYVLKGKNLYGEVSVATLELRGVVVKLRIDKSDIYTDIGAGSTEGAKICILSFDSGKAPLGVPTVEVLAVLTLGYRAETLCLIIEPTEDATRSRPRQYQRIGVARVHSNVLKLHGKMETLYLI